MSVKGRLSEIFFHPPECDPPLSTFKILHNGIELALPVEPGFGQDHVGLTAAQIAQAQEDMASAAEKRSEIPLNRMKTLAQAQKLQAEPLVALVKEQVRLAIAQEKAQQAQRQLQGSQA